MSISPSHYKRVEAKVTKLIFEANALLKKEDDGGIVLVLIGNEKSKKINSLIQQIDQNIGALNLYIHGLTFNSKRRPIYRKLVVKLTELRNTLSNN